MHALGGGNVAWLAAADARGPGLVDDGWHPGLEIKARVDEDVGLSDQVDEGWFGANEVGILITVYDGRHGHAIAPDLSCEEGVVGECGDDAELPGGARHADR